MQNYLALRDEIKKAHKSRPMSQDETRQKSNLEKNIGTCLADFKTISELGRGAYGIVTKVTSKIDQQIYVMKKINVKNVSPRKQAAALKEVQILRKLRHPNIIKYYTSFVEDGFMHIIMEYAEGGDLQMVIMNLL